MYGEKERDQLFVSIDYYHTYIATYRCVYTVQILVKAQKDFIHTLSSYTGLILSTKSY